MIERIRMPVMAAIAKRGVLHMGEWEKLSRLCAVIERDGAKHLRGSWEGRRLFKTMSATDYKAFKIREEIETYVHKIFRDEGLNMQEWVIQASLHSNPLEPESLAEWNVLMWCFRTEPSEAQVEHRPTISEKGGPPIPGGSHEEGREDQQPLHGLEGQEVAQADGEEGSS